MSIALGAEEGANDICLGDYGDLWGFVGSFASQDVATWQGRSVSYEQLLLYGQTVERKIADLFDGLEADPNPDDFSVRLVLSTLPLEKRSLFERDIEKLSLEEEKGLIRQRGFFKKCSKSWKKHKKEILITAAVIAVLATVVIIAATTAGAAAGSAAASSGALLNQMKSDDKLQEESKKEPKEELKPAPIAGSATLQEMSTMFPLETSQIVEKLPSWVKEQVIENSTQDTGYFNQFLKTHYPNIDSSFPMPKGQQCTAAGFFPLSYADSSFTPQPTTLIGNPRQGTVHFHSGINNDYHEVGQAGEVLHNTLENKFAVQPHWDHNKGLVKGLAMVVLEKQCSDPPSIPQGLLPDPMSEIPEIDGITAFSKLLGFVGNKVLRNSNIQEAIKYEVESLSTIAQEILEKNDPKLKQVHVTFSNGGYIISEALKELPQNYRDTIVVVTVGTTTIIDKSVCADAYNLVGNQDLASQLCNGGMAGLNEAKERANVEMIPQKETKLFVGGHYFTQEDYQEAIDTIIESKIINEYKIY